MISVNMCGPHSSSHINTQWGVYLLIGVGGGYLCGGEGSPSDGRTTYLI